ncbi:tetratricopeptide repeat protein [Pseudoxanthomonas putridarboris]|uniref:Tetratricopeptide repeat protein n=1 Tax=Pseudoxanthomonas putridarboris TaxID=752605 RepID=A0ABU9J613_9GAMM
MIAFIMAAALALSTSESVPAPDPAASSAPPRPEQVLAIPDALRQQLRTQVLARRVPPSERLNRLVHFMFDPAGLGMTYREDATHTVAQAYETRQANCLTFTLLAVALAREAGLDAYGQQIEETLAWRQEANTIYLTNHVNAGVRAREQRLTVDVAWNTVMARDPPEPISDERLLAHYYNNRAAELMAEGRPAEGLAYAHLSLVLDPTYATSWSNAGVLYLRDGDPVHAEQSYLHALQLKPMHSGALFNLTSYYQRAGDTTRAARMQARLQVVQSRDPFHHFLLATKYERQGDHARAVDHYKRAIRLYSGEHRFHFGLARAYFQMGDTRRAGKALARARELSEGDTRQLYQAKLDILRRQSH